MDAARHTRHGGRANGTNGTVSATGTDVVVEREEELLEDLDLPWVVIVWDDPVNTMNYVAYVFRKVFGYPAEKAERLMLEVHHLGKSVVASGTRTEAERWVFTLQEHGLWATLQQDR